MTVATWGKPGARRTVTMRVYMRARPWATRVNFGAFGEQSIKPAGTGRQRKLANRALARMGRFRLWFAELLWFGVSLGHAREGRTA